MYCMITSSVGMKLPDAGALAGPKNMKWFGMLGTATPIYACGPEEYIWSNVTFPRPIMGVSVVMKLLYYLLASRSHRDGMVSA